MTVVGGNPWAALRERDELLFDLADLPAGEHGRYYPGERVILLAHGLTYAERRVALAHELGHAEYGDRCTGMQHFDDRRERAADKFAAFWLIDIDAYVDARRWSSSLVEVADDLQVTPRLLKLWLDYLHPARRTYISRNLSITEGAA